MGKGEGMRGERRQRKEKGGDVQASAICCESQRGEGKEVREHGSELYFELGCGVVLA